jgi:hypothetical protein
VVADQTGLHSTDLECLDLLYLNGPVTAATSAELTGLTTGAANDVAREHILRLQHGTSRAKR